MFPSNLQKISSEEDLIAAIPDLVTLREVKENSAWHEHENILTHTLNVLHKVRELSVFDFILEVAQKDKLKAYFQKELFSTFKRGDLIQIASIFHDCAKPETIISNSAGNTKCPHHEEIGAQKTKEILSKYKLNSEVISYIVEVVRLHGFPHVIITPKKSEDQINTELEDFKKTNPNFFLDVMLHAMADTQGSQLIKNNPNEFSFRMAKYKEIFIQNI